MGLRADYLSYLPDEKLLEMSDSFCVRDFINLPQASQRFSLLFFNEHQAALNCLRQLLKHGALGELEASERIWRAFPDLLTCRGTIFFPNRSYIGPDGKPLSQPIDIPLHENLGLDGYDDLTFWQILCVNEEWEEAEEAGKLMTDEEKQKQFAEIFPDGKIIKYDFDLAEAKKRLQALFNEVIKDKKITRNNLNEMSPATRSAFDAVCHYAKPNPKHKKGLVFDPRFYIEALKFYDDDDTFNQFENWEQRIFWCTKLEELLAGRLGTRYLRPHSQGIGNPLTRAGCLLADGSSYHAFRRPSNSIPSLHFLVGYYGGAWTPTSRRTQLGRRPYGGASAPFSKLVSSNNEIWDKLYAAICAPTNIVLSNSLK